MLPTGLCFLLISDTLAQRRVMSKVDPRGFFSLQELAVFCCLPYKQTGKQVSGSGSSLFMQRAVKTLNKPQQGKSIRETEQSVDLNTLNPPQNLCGCS